MSDTLALIVVIAVIAGAAWLFRPRAWRTCPGCGDKICTGCGRHG